MSDLILRAAQFARKAHAGQKRKYTGADFVTHPARVAGRVAIHPDATEEMVAAAFLHDVVEDTEVTINEVAGTFGVIVSELVEELTDPARYILGPKYRTTYRAERKEITKKWLASCSRAAQIIKLIDRIDNLREMPLHSRSKYHTLYTKESLLLAEAIGSADPDLKEELKQICYDYSFYTSH